MHKNPNKLIDLLFALCIECVYVVRAPRSHSPNKENFSHVSVLWNRWILISLSLCYYCQFNILLELNTYRLLFDRHRSIRNQFHFARPINVTISLSIRLYLFFFPLIYKNHQKAQQNRPIYCKPLKSSYNNENRNWGVNRDIYVHKH